MTDQQQAGTEPDRAPARHTALVLQSEATSASFHRLRLQCEPIARQAKPGQFVHILPRSGGLGTTYDPLLRRAFSVMSTSFVQGQEASTRVSDGDSTGAPNSGHRESGVREEETWFEVLFRVGGRGTTQLAQCRAGDTVDVLGALGNGFDLERLGYKDGAQRPLFLVGGGIGVPPLVFAAQTLALAASAVSRETGTDVSRVEAFVGARSAGDLVGQEALQQSGARLHIATDDGSHGHRGVVTDLLRERLRAFATGEESASTGAGRARPVVCACGPWPMLKAVALVCREMKVECYVSLEENMPCGIGVCNGCVVPVLDAQDDYGRFQRICVQGPVLDAKSVDWGDSALSSAGPSVSALTTEDIGSQQGATQ